MINSLCLCTVREKNDYPYITYNILKCSAAALKFTTGPNFSQYARYPGLEGQNLDLNVIKPK